MSAKGSRSIQVAIKVRPCEPGLSRLWQVREGRSIQLTDSHAEPCVFGELWPTIWTWLTPLPSIQITSSMREPATRRCSIEWPNT